MTAINRLTNKPEPVPQDLVPIWDSQSGRTRNCTMQSITELTGSSINPVVNIQFQTPNLIVSYYDGTQQSIDITV